MKDLGKLCLRLLRVWILLVFMVSAETMQAQFLSAPAFPGAEGFGRYTTGGRGGQVYHVTNLNDSGTGSLRAAVEASGRRMVVFDVAGTIELTKDLKIENDNISILGQTAPGDGICLRNYTLKIHANNVIVRYIRCRMGDTAENENDAVSADNQTESEKRNIIIDHCSVSWCVDECGSFYGNENFTLQWCILSESLTNSVHGKGSHGYGGIWGGKKAAFHHNLLAHHNSRNPRFDHGYVSELAGVVDYINNVVYNWGGNSTYGGENKPGLEPKRFNMINNYYKPGPRTTNVSKIPDRLLNPTTSCSNCNSSNASDVVPGKFYINGNLVNGSTVSINTTSASDANLKFDSNYNFESFKSNCLLDSRELSSDNDFGIYNTVSLHSAADAYNKIVNYCGASLRRDAVDERIATEVQNGTYTYTGSNGSTYGLIDSQSDVGGWPELEGTAQADTDQDGIPDTWETSHGLSNSVDNSATYTLDTYGFYTDLEVYANYLVESITKEERADATASFDEYYPLDANAISPLSNTKASSPYISANNTGKVTITSVETGATIYCTTDGTTPTMTSKQYAGAFTVAEPCVVKAIAVVEGKENSSVSSYEVTSYGVANAYLVDAEDPGANAMISGVEGISMTYGACTDWTAGSAGITLKGVTFPNYVATTSSNGSNSTSLATNKPTGNSYWIFNPTKNGTLTVAVHNVGTGKAVCVTEDGTMIGASLIDVDGQASSVLSSTTLSAGGTLPSSTSWSGGLQFEVKAGSTYTYSLAGSKGHLCGFIFEAEETEEVQETVWDFSEFTSENAATEGNNYVVEYNGLTCVSTGNSSDKVNKDGFHMNGSTTSGGRYISYTPSVDGVWTVYFVSNNPTGYDRITAIGTQRTLGNSLTVGENGILAYGYTNGYVWQSISAPLTAGTEYFAYFPSGGQAIKKLVFTPNALATPHTVTFSGNGKGTSNIATATEQEARAGVTLPSVTQGNGYVFLGWAASANTSTPTHHEGDVYYPSTDMTLYAIYRDSVIYTLVDGEDYTLTEDATYEKVMFTKTFSSSLAKKWTALYVPLSFDISSYTNEFDIAEIYNICPTKDTDGDGEVTAADDDVLIVNIVKSGYTLPNVPYMIRAKKAGTITIDSHDGRLYAATDGIVNCYTAKAEYNIIGLNASVTATADNNYYYMASGTISHRTTGTTVIKANRWYMTITPSDNYSAAISAKSAIPFMVMGDYEEETTQVDKVSEVVDVSDNNAPIFNLNGSRVGGRLKAGVYIKNNRKFIVR